MAAMLWLIGSGVAVEAAELVYVHQAGCGYCVRWERDVGATYPRTEEGRRAPLRPIELRDEKLKSLKLSRGVRYTPTFLLVENGAEIGRIEGYSGEDFFWGRLARLLDQLPARHAGTSDTQWQAGLTDQR